MGECADNVKIILLLQIILYFSKLCKTISKWRCLMGQKNRLLFDSFCEVGISA